MKPRQMGGLAGNATHCIGAGSCLAKSWKGIAMAAGDVSEISIAGGVPAPVAFPRHEQTFPSLTSAEIARRRRFCDIRTYKHGERLFEAGKPGLGMFVVLSGRVA